VISITMSKSPASSHRIHRRHEQSLASASRNQESGGIPGVPGTGLMRVGLAVMLCVAMVTGTASLATAQVTERMAEHTIATGLDGAYQVLPIDMNRDQRPDLLFLSRTDAELVWFENPTWQRHVIATGLSSMVYLDAADTDGDGIPEVALAHGFSNQLSEEFPGNISILTHQEDPAALWSIREIDRMPRSHRIRFVDTEGNGKPVVVVLPITGVEAVGPDFRTPVPIFYYHPGEWTRMTLTEAEEGQMHGAFVTRWDGSQREAFLNASSLGITLNRYINGKWMRETLTKGDPGPWPRSGASDIVVGALGQDRLLSAIEPFHGNQIVVYARTEGTWQRQVIDDSLENTHTMAVADLDGDGHDEIIAGVRGGSKQVFLYTRDTSGTWTREILDRSELSPTVCETVDLNVDGLIDVVCTGDAGSLKWYENR